MVIIPKYSNKEIDVPRASLLDLSLFPIFQTREDYEEFTGKPCPPYDPNKDIKKWFDPNPNPEYDEGYWIVYPFSSDIEIKNGVPIKPRKLIVKKVEVSTVNIGTGRTNEPGTGRMYAFPIRPLTENEEFEVGFGGVVSVVNKKLVKQTDKPEVAFDLVLTKLDMIYQKISDLEHKLLTGGLTAYYTNPMSTAKITMKVAKPEGEQILGPVIEDKEGCCD